MKLTKEGIFPILSVPLKSPLSPEIRGTLHLDPSRIDIFFYQTGGETKRNETIRMRTSSVQVHSNTK